MIEKPSGNSHRRSILAPPSAHWRTRTGEWMSNASSMTLRTTSAAGSDRGMGSLLRGRCGRGSPLCPEGPSPSSRVSGDSDRGDGLGRLPRGGHPDLAEHLPGALRVAREVPGHAAVEHLELAEV